MDVGAEKGQAYDFVNSNQKFLFFCVKNLRTIYNIECVH